MAGSDLTPAAEHTDPGRLAQTLIDSVDRPRAFNKSTRSENQIPLARYSEADTRRRHEELISALTLELGAYGDGLDQAYGDFGRWLLEAGDYAEAAQRLRQAWQVSRVNFGLYSEQQLDHLNLLIEALVRQQQWDEVHDLHQLSFLIASRVYSADDVRYLIAAEFYTSWQWRAINERWLPAGHRGSFDLARRLSSIYSEVISNLEHSGSMHTQGLVNLVIGKARTDIGIAKALADTALQRRTLSMRVSDRDCPGDAGVFLSSIDDCGSADARGIHRGPDRAGSYALSLYLKQVDHSISRLERMSDSTDEISAAERKWIETLVVSLRTESEAIVRCMRKPGADHDRTAWAGNDC